MGKALLFSIVVTVVVAFVWGAVAPYARPYYPEELRIPLSMLIGGSAQISGMILGLKWWG